MVVATPACLHIAGRIECLAIGRRCRLAASYRRYGFVCERDWAGRPILFKVVAPGPAPTDCAGAGPTPVSLPSYSTVPAVGAFPFWMRPDLAIDPAAGVWRVKALRRGPGGWYVGWKWLPDARGAPASVSIEDMSHGRPVLIIIHSDEPKTWPRLDEHNFDGNDPEHGWSSRVVFPGAGCYRVDVSWPNGGTNGGTHVSFAFGR